MGSPLFVSTVQVMLLLLWGGFVTLALMGAFRAAQTTPGPMRFAYLFAAFLVVTLWGYACYDVGSA